MNTIFTFMILINTILFPAHENAKNSFAFIHDQVILTVKDELSIPVYIQHEADQINKAMIDFATVKASGFVSSHNDITTNVITNHHVCTEIFESDKPSIMQSVESLLREKINQTNPILFLYYDLSYRYVATDYDGNDYVIKQVIKTEPKTDLCLLETERVWGVPAKINEKECSPSEVIYNMSVSGGIYHPKAVPFRQGFYNGKVFNEIMTTRQYNERSLFTLSARTGASGSAVFNRNGKVCGNISHSISDLDVCYGSTVNDLKSFLR